MEELSELQYESILCSPIGTVSVSLPTWLRIQAFILRQLQHTVLFMCPLTCLDLQLLREPEEPV